MQLVWFVAKFLTIRHDHTASREEKRESVYEHELKERTIEDGPCNFSEFSDEARSKQSTVS